MLRVSMAYSLSPLEILKMPASWVFKMYQLYNFDLEYENALYLLNKKDGN